MFFIPNVENGLFVDGIKDGVLTDPSEFVYMFYELSQVV